MGILLAFAPFIAFAVVDRLVGSEQLARGGAEQECVADLTRGAGSKMIDDTVVNAAVEEAKRFANGEPLIGGILSIGTLRVGRRIGC